MQRLANFGSHSVGVLGFVEIKDVDHICEQFVNLPAASPPCKPMIRLLIDQARTIYAHVPQVPFSQAPQQVQPVTQDHDRPEHVDRRFYQAAQ